MNSRRFSRAKTGVGAELAADKVNPQAWVIFLSAERQ